MGFKPRKKRKLTTTATLEELLRDDAIAKGYTQYLISLMDMRPFAKPKG